jgi:hypothetical protein
MPAPYVDYYAAMADRIVPFLRGRKVAVEQRFSRSPRPVYRRHEEVGGRRDWIRIRAAEDVVRWARQYAVAFHAHLKPEGAGCWFVLDIDSRALDLEMGQLAARHALDVLEEQGLAALVRFSGSDGFHLMWEIPSLVGLGRSTIWDVERAVVRSVAGEVEQRLAVDPAAAPVRAAVGEGGRLIATSSQDAENKGALLFDEHILKPNVNARAPFSIHAGSGLVAVPLDRAGLERFAAGMAEPAAVAAAAVDVELPRNELAVVKRALAAWAG